MAERGKLLRAILLLGIALSGCGADDPAPAADGEADGIEPTQAVTQDDEARPYDSDAEMQPDLMLVEPTEARAGAEAELHFPQETLRGQAFVIEARAGDNWQHRYWLIAVPAGVPVTPRWTRVDEDFGWDDIGIEGPGPDRIVVPDTAEAGEYRVCTAKAGSNFCAELVVAG